MGATLENNCTRCTVVSLSILVYAGKHRPERIFYSMSTIIDSKQLAEYFNVSVRTIASWRKFGLPALTFPGSRLVRFDVAAVERWLQSQQPSQHTDKGGKK